MNGQKPRSAGSLGIVIFLLICTAWADPQTDASLVDALKSDTIRWNADMAQSYLWETDSPPLETLRKALDSTDYQQRQFAADILREKDKGTPSRRLLEVSVEGLRNDQFPQARSALAPYNHVYNASRGVDFLQDHAREAKDFLLAALDSDDDQQRFLCAYTLGMHGIRDRLTDTASILISHLRDNHIRHDASMSCAALYRLGPRVRPFLLAALKDADKQQREAINLLLLDFKSPPKTKRDFLQRKSMQHISPLVHDPAIEFDTPWVGFP